MRQISVEEALEKKYARVGEFLQALTQGRGAEGILEGFVTGISIRLPSTDEPECLLVVKGAGVGGKYVAFVGGLDVVQAVLIWRAKAGAKGLKWREDVPWEQR